MFKSDTNISTLYEYYQVQNFNPVYMGFQTDKDLNDFEVKRRTIFEHNLRLPIRSFRDASLLEFGPASGENSLVFAMWGAKLYLIEPVAQFIHDLRRYFRIHRLENSLREVIQNTFEDFASYSKYDFVVAEGLVSCLGSPSYWIPRLASFGGKSCYIVISHQETYGFLVELLQAKSLQVLSGENLNDNLLLASDLFKKRWDLVSHVRTFNSWVRDTLLNPLTGTNILIHITDIQDIMIKSGLFLWSTWPSVFTNMDMSWIKAPYDSSRSVRNVQQNVLGMIPSLLMGEIVEPSEHILDDGLQLKKDILKELYLLSSLDSAVMEQHGVSERSLRRCIRDFENSRFREFWTEIGDCISAILCCDKKRIVELFNGGGLLATSWGCPNFYSVWHRFS